MHTFGLVTWQAKLPCQANINEIVEIFFFFFWVTGEMFILYRQSTDRDTELT